MLHSEDRFTRGQEEMMWLKNIDIMPLSVTVKVSTVLATTLLVILGKNSHISSDM